MSREANAEFRLHRMLVTLEYAEKCDNVAKACRTFRASALGPCRGQPSLGAVLADAQTGCDLRGRVASLGHELSPFILDYAPAALRSDERLSLCDT